MEVPTITDIGRQAYSAGGVRENVTRYVDEQFVRGKGDGEREANRQKRIQEARNIADNFYTLVSDFYEYGYGHSFHFAPIMGGLTMDEGLAAYERATASTLKAGPGMKLLVSDCVCVCACVVVRKHAPPMWLSGIMILYRCVYYS